MLKPGKTMHMGSRADPCRIDRGRHTMNTPSTRLASIDDVAAIAPLFDAYRQFYEQPPDLARAAAFLHDRIGRRESVVIMAEDGDHRALGFCQLYPGFCSVLAAPIYTLHDLFVRPEARGSGVGTALLKAAKRHAGSQGAVRMDLSTARINLTAQSLYESLGWIRDDQFLVYNLTVTPGQEP
jgi:GNAT superfamily N-acetyltransferase